MEGGAGYWGNEFLQLGDLVSVSWRTRATSFLRVSKAGPRHCVLD